MEKVRAIHPGNKRENDGVRALKILWNARDSEGNGVDSE